MEQYLMYLRKSRADRDAEARGQGDTLTRHRVALTDLARDRGFLVTHIYEEVVSGETITARPEMQKLLRAVESGGFAGVLVMEVERLARGNTRDQGVVAETFQYSGTKIITPMKIYDPNDESDQEYFEFGLFMSRREYQTINRRLQRGRAASLREGKFIAGAAPYGYRRVKLPGQKGYTLEPIPEEAEVVHRIFSLYVNGASMPGGGLRPCGATAIARRLDEEGVPAPSGGRWPTCTIKDILVNPTYVGQLRWSYRPTVKHMEEGQVRACRPVNHQMEPAPGMHPPIVAEALWAAAQTVRDGRARAPMPLDRTVQNPLAGLVFCSVCGRSMERRSQSRGRALLMCPTRDCPTKGAVLEEVEQALLDALDLWLAEYRVEAGAAPVGVSESLREARGAAARAEGALQKLQAQRARLCDLLEQGVYTPEVFTARSGLLAEKMDQAKGMAVQARAQLAQEETLAARRQSVTPKVERVLEGYVDLDSPQEKNELWRLLLARVVYTKTKGGRYCPSDLELEIFPKTR